MSEYDDVLHLRDKGVWPNQQVLAWALSEADRLKTHPTAAVISMGAMVREIERLRAEVAELYSRLAPKLGSLRLDVDNPLYNGLVLECLEPGVLAATVRYLKAERDDARKVVMDLRDYILALIRSGQGWGVRNDLNPKPKIGFLQRLKKMVRLAN